MLHPLDRLEAERDIDRAAVMCAIAVLLREATEAEARDEGEYAGHCLKIAIRLQGKHGLL